MTARFARLSDLSLQRVFRRVGAIELIDEGTALDRLRRMEKRGVIPSAERWRELRLLRNQIADEYLLESADEVLRLCLAATPELLETARGVERYVAAQGYVAGLPT